MRSLLFFRACWGAVLFLLLFQILFPAWRIVPLIYGQTAVPLHYNIHFGVDTIGEWWRVFTVPAVGLAIALINGVSARRLWKREKMLAYLAVGATLFLEVFLSVAMVFIVLLNISYG